MIQYTTLPFFLILQNTSKYKGLRSYINLWKSIVRKSPVSYVSILLYDDSGNFLLFYSRSADSPSPGLSKILSAAYNFGTCFLELPAIVLWVMYI